MNTYIERNATKLVEKISHDYPVVMITGPRQAGKTTLLKKVLENGNKKVNFVTLDNLKLRELANSDPELFLETYKPPLVIDEFQYAPNLLSYIKIIVDNERFNALDTNKSSNGLYYLTGSKIFETMEQASESLAGRIGIVDLYCLSTNEIERSSDAGVFIPEIDNLKKIKKNYNLDVNILFERIFKGSYPELWNKTSGDIEKYYDDYISTYLERDIFKLINVKDELKFMRFLISVASRTATELHYTTLAEDADISVVTAKEWMSLLVNSHIVYLLQPFSAKTKNRLIKTHKIYMTDTGLACYLAGYKDPVTLEKSAYNGQIFETYVISEIIKSFCNNGLNPTRYLSFYRDKEQREIDLIIEYNKKIYPIEIKKSKSPSPTAAKNFSVLNELDNVSEGIVLCMIDEIFPIDKDNYYVPIELI